MDLVFARGVFFLSLLSEPHKSSSHPFLVKA